MRALPHTQLLTFADQDAVLSSSTITGAPVMVELERETDSLEVAKPNAEWTQHEEDVLWSFYTTIGRDKSDVVVARELIEEGHLSGRTETAVRKKLKRMKDLHSAKQDMMNRTYDVPLTKEEEKVLAEARMRPGFDYALMAVKMVGEIAEWRSRQHADKDEQDDWKIAKAEYERRQFNLNKELSDVRERMEDVSRANGQMLEELSRHTGEIEEHVNRQRQLESARNDLSDKNIALEFAISRLKIEKEEKDAAAVSATKEAQAALVETFALKDQLKQLTTEKAALAHSMEAFQHERQSIEFERQKYAAERNLHAESKRCMMQEVAERDNRVSCLRLELENKDLEGANERLQFEAKINLLTTQIDSLNAKVNMLTFNNSELIKRLENTELSKASEYANLEEEIRCQTELQNVMKNSVDEAKMAADLFKDQLDAQDNVLVEVRKVLQEHQDDMEREQADHAEALRERDDELANTRAELAKVNEMIKSMSDVKLNVSEEELSELAPAAAETVRFMEGGHSLSGLVLEHARAYGKLAESEAKTLRYDNEILSLEIVLESELDEAKRKLLETEATQKRMDAEHAISASHNTVASPTTSCSAQH